MKPTESNNGNGDAPANNGTSSTPVLAVEPFRIPDFPNIVVRDDSSPIKFGEQSLTFPVSATESVQIDCTMFAGKPGVNAKTLKLVKIKKALQLAGRDESSASVDWFNKNVRDQWHKVLRFANRNALEHGTPVSLGVSMRQTKKNGQVLSTKHGFEFALGAIRQAAESRAVEGMKTETEKSKSKSRAERQAAAKKAEKAAKINPIAPVLEQALAAQGSEVPPAANSAPVSA